MTRPTVEELERLEDTLFEQDDARRERLREEIKRRRLRVFWTRGGLKTWEAS